MRQGSGETGKDFSLSVTVPLFHASSILATNSDGSSIEVPDWHILPDAELQWSHQYSAVRTTAYAALRDDTYFEVDEANTITVEGGLLIEFTDGRSSAFVPYLSYIGRSYFDGNFESLDDNRHDFAGGIFFGRGWRSGRQIDFDDVGEAGDQSLSLDVQGGYRAANEIHREHLFASATLAYTLNITNDLWISVAPKVRVRHYDEFFGSDRDDLRLSVLTKLVWKPEWLSRILPGARLSAEAEYFHNDSTDELSEYRLWEIGPSLRLTKKF